MRLETGIRFLIDPREMLPREHTQEVLPTAARIHPPGGRAAGAGIAATVQAVGHAAVELALGLLGDEAPRPAALPHREAHR